MLFTFAVLVAMLVGLVLITPWITGGPPPTVRTVRSQLLLGGAAFVLIGIGWQRMFRPVLAVTRGLLARSVVADGEVVALGRSRMGGIARPTVRFLGVDGTEQTRQLAGAGRYVIGQQLRVRHDPANDLWLIPDRTGAPGLDPTTVLARGGWLIIAAGVVLLACELVVEAAG